MADRIPSDHPSVETTRVPLETSGATSRPVVELPGDADVEAGVVRLVLDGTEYHAEVQRPLTGDGYLLRGAYDTPDAARNADGPNRLAEWVDEGDARVGGSVLFDVVEAGHTYGLRAPGTRQVYRATESPDDSLSAIAEDLDGE
jgi:hypothetical protein